MLNLDKNRGWEVTQKSKVNLDNGSYSPIWPKNLKAGPVAPFELSDSENSESEDESEEKGFTELNDEFEDIIVKTRRSLSVDSIRPVTAHSVKKQRSFSINSSEDWPKTAQSEDNTAILNSKYT